MTSSYEEILEQILWVKPPRPGDKIDYGRYLDDLEKQPEIEQTVREIIGEPPYGVEEASRPFIDEDKLARLIEQLPWVPEEKLRKLLQLREPVTIPDEVCFSGVHICAPPGKGKTLLIQHLVLKYGQKPCSLILMDSKPEEDLLRPFKLRQVIREESLIILDPGPIAINPLSIPNTTPEALVDLNVYIFSGITGMEYTPKQGVLLKYILRTLITCYPNPTIMDFIDIMRNGVRSGISLTQELKDFFDNDFQDSTYKKTAEEIQYRLRDLLFNPVIKAIFSCKHTKLDLAKEMNAGKVLLINASTEKLGEAGSSFYQRLWIALILNAARTRKGNSLPCYVFCDEIQLWAANDRSLVTILDTCRSARIAMHLSHQRVKQLSPTVLDALLNCAVTFANPEADASTFAGKLRRPAGELNDRPVGTFAGYARGVGPFDYEVPLPDFNQFPERTFWQRTSYLFGPSYYYTPEPIPEHSDTKSGDDIEMKPSKDW